MAFAAGPSLTPEYAAKKKAFDANAPEDSETANCLPPGMPGIMGQPYPMEFLLTPGQVTIVIEAYTQVRHIYTDGRPLPEDPDLKLVERRSAPVRPVESNNETKNSRIR